MTNIRIFYLIFIFHVLVVKFSLYLNRHVFVVAIMAKKCAITDRVG